jgi:hypothetical protein
VDKAREDQQGVGLASMVFAAILEAYSRVVGSSPLVLKDGGKGIDIGATVQLICGTGVYGSTEVMLAPDVKCISETKALEMAAAAEDGKSTIGKLIIAAKSNLARSGRAEQVIKLVETRMRSTIG